MSIDTMNDKEIEEALVKLERTDPAGLNKARLTVRAFMNNPANLECARMLRKGLLAKVALAVYHGETLTKEAWSALAGYGREYQSSFEAHR